MTNFLRQRRPLISAQRWSTATTFGEWVHIELITPQVLANAFGVIDETAMLLPRV